MFLKSFPLLGEIQQMWLNKFKVALVQKDVTSLEKLLDEVPDFSSKSQAQSALYLFKEAIELLHMLKESTSISMKQIKQNIDFLESTQIRPQSTLDIKL